MRALILVPILLGVAAIVALVGLGCGTGADGTTQCEQIEEARCNRAYECPSISLEPPYSTSGTDVQACIQFYEVACLHGLTVPPPPSGELSECLLAINGAKGDAACGIIEAPWSVDACAWLSPPPVPEASTDASDAGDAGDGAASDGTVSSDASGDEEIVIGL